MAKVKIVGIYKITSPSGKVYIGQSWDIKGRWLRYRYQYRNQHPKLYASFDKHGRENHLFEIATELPHDISQSVLDGYELLYCDFYKSVGINLLNIREGRSRGRLSEEAKQNLSNYWKGRNIGIPLKKETKEKLKIAKQANRHLYIGNTYSKNSKPMLGRKHTAETKIKIANSASKGKWEIFKGKELLGVFDSSIDASFRIGIPASTLRRIRTDGRKIRAKKNTDISIRII